LTLYAFAVRIALWLYKGSSHLSQGRFSFLTNSLT
jgi:hypothetical protein